ncbi:Uncharacterised protein [Shigella sonnei]|nr:Uncharacterised protein [Shigella sonnei]
MCTRAGYQFSTGTAYIHHQALIGTASCVSNALINQTCFLFTADHLYRTTEDFLRIGNKITRIDGKT